MDEYQDIFLHLVLPYVYPVAAQAGAGAYDGRAWRGIPAGGDDGEPEEGQESQYACEQDHGAYAVGEQVSGKSHDSKEAAQGGRDSFHSVSWSR